jgi:hypothetical protein
MARMVARKPRAGDWVSKERELGWCEGVLAGVFLGEGTESRRTKPIDSPSRDTTAWSATVPGLVRKKKPRVMWKRQSEVRIVRADMSAMVSVGWCSCGRSRALHRVQLFAEDGGRPACWWPGS